MTLHSVQTLLQSSIQPFFFTFLAAFIQPQSHICEAEPNLHSPPISSSICPLLSSVILLLSLSPLKQHSSISLSLCPHSHPVARNFQFILCPLVLPSLLLSVIVGLLIHPSTHGCNPTPLPLLGLFSQTVLQVITYYLSHSCDCLYLMSLDVLVGAGLIYQYCIILW